MRYRLFALLLLSVTLVALGVDLSSPALGRRRDLPRRTVCPEGPPQCQFPTIGEAIAAAEPGDLIQIMPGTYRETLVIAKPLRLVGAGRDRVLIEGIEPGEPTITLQVEGELEVLLDGVALTGGPPASAARACREDELGRMICPHALAIRGRGAVSLTIVDTQVFDGAIICHSSLFDGVTARLMLLRSSLAGGSGVVWSNCADEESTIAIWESTVSGNVGWGLDIVGRNTVEIRDSVFAGNGIGVRVDFGAGGGEATISRSQFLHNQDAGIQVEMSNGLIRLERVFIAHNGRGVNLFGGAGKLDLIIQDSIITENGGENIYDAGLSIFIEGTVEIQGNLIKGNKNGVVIGGADPIHIYDNRILENEGWGLALLRPPCLRAEVNYLPRIEGRGNVIRDNGQGDLCPEDYPWPEDFLEP